MDEQIKNEHDIFFFPKFANDQQHDSTLVQIITAMASKTSK